MNADIDDASGTIFSLPSFAAEPLLSFDVVAPDIASSTELADFSAVTLIPESRVRRHLELNSFRFEC